MITSMGRGATRPVPRDPVSGTATRRWRGRVLARYSFWLAVAAIGWYLLAPVQLGGYDNYVLTDGTSMLPVIHGGGLVITRKESSYHVGEIVAYHSAAMGGAVILHRIVAINHGYYTFKGDNNQQADLFPPEKSALVGKKWIYWTDGATLIENLKTPWIGGLLLGLFGMWAFADIGRKKDGEDEGDAGEDKGLVILAPVPTEPSTQIRLVGAGPLR